MLPPELAELNTRPVASQGIIWLSFTKFIPSPPSLTRIAKRLSTSFAKISAAVTSLVFVPLPGTVAVHPVGFSATSTTTLLLPPVLLAHENPLVASPKVAGTGQS